MHKRIGIPIKKEDRQYNLVDLDTGETLGCSHPVPDSSLCDKCYGRLIKEAEEISLI